MEIKYGQGKTKAVEMSGEDALKRFFEQQLLAWPDAKQRFDDLKGVLLKPVACADLTFYVQYNPARLVSTGAKIDKTTLAQRPCFLCEKNRPAVQTQMPIGNNFELLVNPFPILPLHFTIPAKRHQPQLISEHYGVMRLLLERFEYLIVFYNGPKCGASAPDHMHLQAGKGSHLPLLDNWEQLYNHRQTLLTSPNGTELVAINNYACPAFAIIGCDAKADEALFKTLYKALPQREDETEPMFNILKWREAEGYVTVIIPRHKHRPDCYSAEGDAQMLISPGALDMAGLVITPRKEDFERLNAPLLEDLYKEVGMQRTTFEEVKRKLKEQGVKE